MKTMILRSSAAGPHIRTRYQPDTTARLSAIIFVLFLTVQGATTCPLQCQCNSLYYVYCSQAALNNGVINEAISRVSTSAKLLDLSSNQISRISPRLFGKLVNLQTLNLAENRISQLASNVFQNLTRLREMRLDSNSVTSLDKTTFVGLQNLKKLRLDHNSISVISGETFSKMPSLETLHLQKNSLESLEPKTFSGMKNLKSLELSENGLKSIDNFTFSGLHSMETLSIYKNRLSTFHKNSYAGLSNLINLDLSHNVISDINFLEGQDFHPRLSSLKLSNNQISNIPGSILPYYRQLRVLDLYDNKIHRIASQSFKSLRLHQLNLSSNSLVEIDRYMFKDLPLVFTLDLSKNRINDIITGAFDSFRERILELIVNNNALKEVHTGMFRRMAVLRKLNLKDNSITKIDDGSFREMVLLEELNLSGNKMVHLSYNGVRGSLNLRHLDLTGNPINEMTEFKFDDDSTNSKILVEVNSSVDSVSQSGASISWPYRHGTQLYWTVSVRCFDNQPSINSENNLKMKNASFSSKLPCPTPPYPDSLKPYSRKLVLDKLEPEQDYFVCVDPVFLSPLTRMTQCAKLRTTRPLSDQSSVRQEGEISPNAGINVTIFRFGCSMHFWSVFIFILLVYSRTH